MSSSTRKALSLLPPFATTGIGSLPHTQLELGLQVALHNDVPFVPQLPAGVASELMIAGALDGFPGVRFDDDGVCEISADWSAGWAAAMPGAELSKFEPSPQALRSFRPFLFEVETRKLPFAKVQMAGPLTVRWVAKTTAGAVVSDLPELDAAVLKFLVAKATALVRAVKRANATPIIFLDEPGLFALEPKNVRHLLALQEERLLVQALQQEGAVVGLHTCSNTVWPRVLELGLDVLSMDARLSLDALLVHRDALRNFFSQGSTLSLGVVPTDVAKPYDLDDIVAHVEAFFGALTDDVAQRREWARRCWLTPACGLGMRSVKDAERIVSDLKSLQQRFRADF